MMYTMMPHGQSEVNSVHSMRSISYIDPTPLKLTRSHFKALRVFKIDFTHALFLSYRTELPHDSIYVSKSRLNRAFLPAESVQCVYQQYC